MREQCHSVHSRHPEIEQNDVGIRPRDDRQRFASRPRHSDQLDVVHLIEGGLDPLENEVVIIDRNDPQSLQLPQPAVLVLSAGACAQS
jgi:hypothetical protein